MSQRNCFNVNSAKLQDKNSRKKHKVGTGQPDDLQKKKGDYKRENTRLVNGSSLKSKSQRSQRRDRNNNKPQKGENTEFNLCEERNCPSSLPIAQGRNDSLSTEQRERVFNQESGGFIETNSLVKFRDFWIFPALDNKENQRIILFNQVTSTVQEFIVKEEPQPETNGSLQQVKRVFCEESIRIFTRNFYKLIWIIIATVVTIIYLFR